MKKSCLFLLFALLLLQGCTATPTIEETPSTESPQPTASTASVWTQISGEKITPESYEVLIPNIYNGKTINELYDYAHNMLNRNELFFITWGTGAILSPSGQLLAYASNKSNLELNNSLHLLDIENGMDSVLKINEQTYIEGSDISPAWWIDDSTLIVSAFYNNGFEYWVCTLNSTATQIENATPIELEDNSCVILAHDRYLIASYNGNDIINGIAEYIIGIIDSKTYKYLEIARYSSKDYFLTATCSIDEDRGMLASILQAKSGDTIIAVWRDGESSPAIIEQPSGLSANASYPISLKWLENGLTVSFSNLESSATETWLYICV